MVDEGAGRSSERAVTLVAPDLNGTLRARHIPAGRFDPDDTPCFADIVFAFDAADRLIPRPAGFAGWWPSWDDGFGDLLTAADLTSRRPLGWRPGGDVVFADLRHRDGTAVAVAPRQLLRRLVEHLHDAALAVRIGTELEFFLADAGADAHAHPGADAHTAYAFTPLRRDHDAILETVDGLVGSGIGVASWYTEGGARQYEIALDPDDPVGAADRAILARCAVQDTARRHGLRATFAPKPGPGYGSGLHAHVSVHDRQGRNLLRALDTGAAARPGRQALAGILAVLGPATAMLTPSPDGYRRLAPHTAAGTTATWAHDNRTAGVRYLDRAGRSRLEIRTAASDANPYLLIAAVLAGIAHGIRDDQTPPPAGRADIYSRVPPGAALPADLVSAVAALRGDPVLGEHLGAGFVEHYAATRLWAAGAG